MGRGAPGDVEMTCRAALAVSVWRRQSLEPAAREILGSDVGQIDHMGAYACRNVNNGKTGNLSFHAFADALDIMGLTLSDGRRISIAPGFNGTAEQGRDILHFARDAACARFMTVLSPDADSFHQDNLHLDLACHGKACTTRLCQ